MMNMAQTRQTFVKRVLARSLTLAFALWALMALCAAAPAFARSYEITSVDIDATVADDGTISVVEVREFEFDGQFNGVYWEIPEGHYEGREVEVTILYGGVLEGGQVVQYEQSDSEDNQTYQVRDYSSMKELKIFSRAEDETVRFVMAYEVTGITSRWSDTGELYWKYVSDGWDEESQNVTMTLHLPVPEGVTVVPEDNVRAWGHGPLDGEVRFSGNDIVYFSPGVGGEEFAEARVAFPAEWLPNEEQSSTARLQITLDEEQEWADEANRQRERARAIMTGGTGIGIAAIVGSIGVAVMYNLRMRKLQRTEFQDEYFRDVPTADHPAVLGTLYNSGTVNSDAFTATLMRLSDNGLVRLDRAKLVQKKFLGGEKVEDDYLLTKTDFVRRGAGGRSMIERDADAIDDEAMDFLFRTCARRAHDMSRSLGGDIDLGGEPPLYFSMIEKVAKKHPAAYSNAYDSWSGQVSAAYEKRFKSEGSAISMGLPVAVFIIDVIVAIAFMFFALGTGMNLLAGVLIFIGLVASAIVLIISAFAWESLNTEGLETKAKLKALRKWLQDFTRLEEAIPEDVVLWNRLLVMAAALGVAEDVVKQLEVVAQQILRDPYMQSVYSWYYYDGYSRRWVSPAQSINNSVTTAHSITTAELAESSSSSGGGGGGGFSSGGGGGFGGGGGGGAF